MKTRRSTPLTGGASASLSSAAVPHSFVATATATAEHKNEMDSRRQLRPRRRATKIRGAPPGATAPHAAPRIGGRVTRGLAAKIKAESTDSSSSSDEIDDYSPPPTQTPSTSQLPATRSSRLRTSSHQPSASRPPAPTRHPGTSRLGKRGRPQSGFYGEDSDDDEDLENAYLSPSPEDDHPPAPVARAHRISPRASRFKKPMLVKSPRREKTNVTTVQPVPDEESTGNTYIPDWPSLPYFILVQIMEYASAPDQDGVSWLLSTSRVCKAFAEPAITALYRCPALLSRPMAHQLLALLSKDPSTTMFNYRAKVERLEINIGEVAAKTYKGQHLDFGALVSNLPRLKVINLTHDLDSSPYRSLDENLRWHYPNVLFEALNQTQTHGSGTGIEVERVERQPTRLTGWKWNSRMMGPELNLDSIRALHSTPSFASLKELSFMNFQVPSLRAIRGDDDPEAAARDLEVVRSVADAISALPDLEYLSMESSTVVNEHFLPLLPKTLKSLSLVNCWDINGEDFASYLLSNGHMLQHLHLDHNQSLSLAFLTILGTACPNLRSLRMDLKTFNHHEFYRDSDPIYSHLLTVDQVPHWPETLETLELKNMRKWGADGAEALFRSLVDSAPILPRLRYLHLKAMLDIPFRQRSGIRDKWERELKRVFLRKVDDPLPFRSLRQLFTEENIKSPRKPNRSQKSISVESPSRRSGRIAAHISNPSSRASSIGRDLRKNTQGRPSYAEPETDEDEGEDDDDAESSSVDGMTPKKDAAISTPASPEDADFFHHGMCDKVEIVLDNQKLREQTMTMDDFVDPEMSDDPSDEDWNGDRDVDADYAW